MAKWQVVEKQVSDPKFVRFGCELIRNEETRLGGA